MSIPSIQPERIKRLNKAKEASGDYIVYWMQASQRTHYNHALDYSINQALRLKKPLIVYFGLTSDYPEANLRHYTFMLEGLLEVKKSLEEMNIELVILNRSPEIGAVEMAENASLMVTDRGYMDILRRWREYVAQKIKCPLIQVETDVVVPIETASLKEEYAAATIRRKINQQLEKFLTPLETSNYPSIKGSFYLDLDSLRLDNMGKVLNKLDIDRSVENVNIYRGGTTQAFIHLKKFLEHKLDRFTDLRNDPSQEYLSNMSPYLHFGQISPLYMALKVSNTDSPGSDAYLEELVIRRELSMNFVYYNPQYDNIKCLPDWAKKTLKEHENDPRPYIYSLEELENAETHDPYWNAAQKEMVFTGKMHGYMRMYWGKKILEWVDHPTEAYQIALYLNNKYELDGRDANGYTGVAWCFGKHDRAWKEREVFGKVRYMNDKGLKRKFKIDNYVDRVDGIIELIEEGLI
jgi:deoxyribodipyrimidine photo-lyase